MLGGRDARRLLHQPPQRIDVVRQLTQTNRTGSYTLGVCPVLDDGIGAHAASLMARAAANASPQRILLVETFRKSSVFCGEYGVSRTAPGLQEMMLPPPANRFDTIHRTIIDNLFLLPSGGPRLGFAKPSPDSPAPTSQVEWMHRMLVSHFPGIVMELPPLGVWHVKRGLKMHHVPDAVVLVARSGGVTYSAVRRAVRRLKEMDARLIGSLLL